MDAVAAKPFSADDFRQRATRQNGSRRRMPDGVRRFPAQPRHRHLDRAEPESAGRGGAGAGRRPWRRSQCHPHPAHRNAAQAFRPGGLSRAAPSTRPTPRRNMQRCARREEEIGLEPPTSKSSAVCRIMSPAAASASRRCSASCGRASTDLNPGRSRRRFRGAAVFPDGPGKPSPRKPHLAGEGALLSTMPYGERYIWGMTAGIVRTLYERLYA